MRMPPVTVFILTTFLELPKVSSTLDEYTDLARFATITLSSECSSCNTTCPYGSSTRPPTLVPLTTKDAECATPSETPPSDVNGKVQFDSTTTNCSSVNDSATAGSSTNYFTVSLWVKPSCSSNKCILLRLNGNALEIEVQGSSLHLKYLNGADNSHSITPNSWQALLIRYNGKIAVFHYSATSPWTKLVEASWTPSIAVDIQIGGTVLQAPNNILMADIRFYNYTLTDREFSTLTKQPFEVRQPNTTCRCPETHPTVAKMIGNYNGHNLRCTDGTSSFKLRLNSDAGYKEYAIDGNNATAMQSGSASSYIISAKMTNSFQIRMIEMALLEVDVPVNITLELRNNGHITRRIELKTTCEVDKECLDVHSYTTTYSSGTKTVAVDVEVLFPGTNRSEYERLVANEVLITLQSDDSSFHFSLGELHVTGRCDCYNNAGSCTRAQDRMSYNCSCSSDTNTTGAHCENCDSNYYRLKEDFNCSLPCDCNMNGSSSPQCEDVGGQCTCKSNTEEKKCDKCKFNTVNLGSDASNGCKSCTCTPVGIHYCASNESCICKANVETTSGECRMCNTNFYNISQGSGCSACRCNTDGTVNQNTTCHVGTGQCHCKTNVEGRTCSTCKSGFWDLKRIPTAGCKECECNVLVGADSNTCEKTKGQCPCRDGVITDRKCQPQVDKVVPPYGPKAGGTLVTVTGKLLYGNAAHGANIGVYFGTEEMELIDRNDTSIIFRTKPSLNTNRSNVSLNWHGDLPDFFLPHIGNFEHRPDPDVLRPGKALKVFASGGCKIDFSGSNLFSVYQPKLMIYTASKGLDTICHQVSGEVMECTTPNFTAHGISQGDFSFGFFLDNITDFLNLTARSSESIIEVEPDPELTMDLNIDYRNVFDEFITLKGKRLDAACSKHDITVTLGGKNCAITKISNTEITCDPEEKFPGSGTSGPIVVKIGNKETVVGKVKLMQFWELTEFIGIACGVGALLLIIIIVIIVCICRRRKSSDKSSLNRPPKDYDDHALGEMSERPRNNYVDLNKQTPLVTNQQTTTDDSDVFINNLQTSVSEEVKNSLIDRQQIEIGNVCKARGDKTRILDGKFTSNCSSPFAGNNLMIKTLKENYKDDKQPKWINDGLQECIRLRDLYNGNILNIVGIAVDSKKFYILYPEIDRSLKDHVSDSAKNFAPDTLIGYCIQVTEGMDYLHNNNITHKDLAARNCTIDFNDVVKISDASFSTDLYKAEYHKQGGKLLPVRWMAVESLRQPGFYDSKTDVWSFGVLAWEVITKGVALPYYDVANDADIRSHVERGFRLGCPEGVDNFFKILQDCWEEDSRQRPSATTLINRITEALAPTDNYVNTEELNMEASLEGYLRPRT